MINELIGKTLTSVCRDTNRYGDDGLLFTCDDGSQYWMGHYQDCCEYVYLADQNEHWFDLIGSPILVAEERSSDPDKPNEYEDEEWTFYTFRTVTGSVDLRWIGTSNGYYSTSVSFERKDN